MCLVTGGREAESWATWPNKLLLNQVMKVTIIDLLEIKAITRQMIMVLFCVYLDCWSISKF